MDSEYIICVNCHLHTSVQVTVKPPVASHTEKEPLPSSGSLPVVKAEAPKTSSKGENSFFPHKKIEASSSSSFSQPKPGLEASYVSAASAGSVTLERDVSYISSTPGSTPMDGSASVSTTSADGDKIVVAPNFCKDKHEKPGNRDLQDQVSHGLSICLIVHCKKFFDES